MHKVRILFSTSCFSRICPLIQLRELLFITYGLSVIDGKTRLDQVTNAINPATHIINIITLLDSHNSLTKKNSLLQDILIKRIGHIHTIAKGLYVTSMDAKSIYIISYTYLVSAIDNQQIFRYI